MVVDEEGKEGWMNVSDEMCYAVICRALASSRAHTILGRGSRFMPAKT